MLPGIWHPMITMHVLAYGGMYLNKPMRESHPWLIPIHAVLFMTHCI